MPDVSNGFSHLLMLLEWYNGPIIRPGLPGEVPGDVPGHDRLRGEETLEHLTLLITQTGDLRTKENPQGLSLSSILNNARWNLF